MESTNRTRALIFIQHLRGFGNVKINKYVPLIESVEQLKAYILENEKGYSVDELIAAENATDRILNSLINQSDIRIISVFDKEYPQGLNDLGNKKPCILYAKGDLSCLNIPSIAVVGTRKPSEWTERFMPGLIRTIIDNTGRVIVSGLALGCDKLAHEGTLSEKGRTIAVLPCGINTITPVSNKGLANQIVNNNGCLVSMYDPSEKPQKSMFVERDTYIAAISEATFVVQCGQKSGTIHTADAAWRLKRKIGVYYTSNVEHGDYSGNAMLLSQHKATLCSNKIELASFLETIDAPDVNKSIQQTFEDYSKETILSEN